MTTPLERAQRRVERLRSALAAAEKRLTIEALKATGGNRTHAARLLGVSERTIFRRVEEMGDTAPPPPEPGGA